MEEREKIKQIYKKIEVRISDDYIDDIMNNKKRVKSLMRIYKQEEIESMNYILGKPEDNTTFTKFELELCSKIDLFNRKVVNRCKNIYENEMKEANA